MCHLVQVPTVSLGCDVTFEEVDDFNKFIEKV